MLVLLDLCFFIMRFIDMISSVAYNVGYMV